MTREELEFRATRAIGRWNDPSLPPMAGRPSFQAIAKEPLENVVISYQLLKYNRQGYVYLFDAQEVLDSFDAIDGRSSEASLDEPKAQ
jgi:hypothetical protein